ncbi:hypothetical protein [Acidipila sp. EB88]|uniref:hypothetical protein n=1 Tax=Acidipila sp. EB88 TaxID=2305226 RepID=UPI000F5F5CFE|nr:hypothetical protein [Acidipila sp. EB88]
MKPASLALLLGGAACAFAQGNPGDNQYVVFSPATVVSTEPFTLSERSPNVPNGQAVLVQLTTYNPAQPLAATTLVGQCKLLQSNGGASCVLGRAPAGTYLLYVSAANGGTQYLNVQEALTIAAPGANRNAALQGQYAFLLTTPTVGDPSQASASAMAGSFTADGQGHITAGVMDQNGAAGTETAAPLTGSYQLGADGTGSVTLQGPRGNMSFTLYVPVPQAAGNVAVATLVSAKGSAFAGSGTLVNQSGTLQSATAVNPGFGPSLGASYQFTADGEAFPQWFPLSTAGQFRFSANGTLQSAGKLLVNGTAADYAGVAGTYTPVDATTGRATMTLASPGQPVIEYAIYETAQQGFLFLSLSPHTANPLIEGTATANQ